MNIEQIKFVVKHLPTKSIFGFSNRKEANKKAEQLNRDYVIANRITRSKALIFTFHSYLQWCAAEELSITEALQFDNY